MALQSSAMAGYVTVVTDSTACLPTDMAARWGISIVQQQLHVGDHLDDEARIAPQTLLDAFADGTPLSTSPPDPGAFFWTYQEAAAGGATAIVSIHLSGRMSDTVRAAREAAQQVRIPVHVLDSATTGMSLGFAAVSAARAAAAGGQASRVIEAAERRFQSSTEFIYGRMLTHLFESVRFTHSHLSRLLQLADAHTWVRQFINNNRKSNNPRHQAIMELLQLPEIDLFPARYKRWPSKYA